MNRYNVCTAAPNLAEISQSEQKVSYDIIENLNPNVYCIFSNILRNTFFYYLNVIILIKGFQTFT